MGFESVVKFMFFVVIGLVDDFVVNVCFNVVKIL